MKKVTVIIPTYNRGGVVSRAIDSVLSQTFQDFEIIVIDDGSSDNTENVLKAYESEISVIKTKNRGVSAARNIAIRASKGEFIAGLDSDDYWHKDKLSKQLDILQKNPEYKVIYTNEIWIRNGKKINQCKQHQKYTGHIYKMCLPLCIISPSSAMIEKSVFEEVGLFDESLPACEDYDLWLRISRVYKIFFLDENLIYKTGGHDDQLSKKYWGMDRFRVKSLQKMLNLKLNDDERVATLEMLKKKLTILVNGCEKHLKIEEARTFKWTLDKLNSIEISAESEGDIKSDS